MVESGKKYNLENRTMLFAKNVRNFTKKLPKSISVVEDVRQVVRSSGSIGANYIEANEALSKKDFGMRIKICRKEAKETIYWLKLIDCPNGNLTREKEVLSRETTDLMMIFGSIFRKLPIL